MEKRDTYVRCPFCNQDNTKVVDSRPVDVYKRQVHICKKLISDKNGISGVRSQNLHCLVIVTHRRLVCVLNIIHTNRIIKGRNSLSLVVG